MKKIFSFLKNYYFYRVDEIEKQMVREKVLKEDYVPYIAIMFLIVFFQLVMLIRSYIVYGIAPNLYELKPHVLCFRLLYAGLAFVCLFSSGIVTLLRNSDKKLGYFITESITMFLINLWGIGISILDSWNGIDLTVYAYVTILISAMVTLEPWVVGLDCLLSTVILNLLCYFLPSTREFTFASSSVIINSITIFGLAMILSTFSFYRRIKKIKMETTINDLNEKLIGKSIIDELTGLKNRRYLTEHINDTLNIGFQSTSIMMADIDSFKKINDNFGHVVGDEVLREVGRIILEVVDDLGYAVRYGGEEFLLYFKNITKSEFMMKAEELRKKIADVKVEVEEEVYVHFTISIGLAIASNRVSFSGLITEADENLYNAKLTKNCYYPKTLNDLRN